MCRNTLASWTCRWLKAVFQSHDTLWFFQGALTTSASSGDTLSDTPLIHAPFSPGSGRPASARPRHRGGRAAELRQHRTARPDGGDLRGLLLHGLGGRRPGDGGGGAERGAVGAGDDSADAVAPGRRHGGGLLGRAAERDVPGRADAAHVHGHGDRRLGRRRRRERADRLRDAPGRVRGRRPPDGDRGAGRQRRPGDRGVLRRRRRPDGGRGQRHEGVRVPERAGAGDGDDPADEDAPGRRHGGGLLGRARERDVPVPGEAEAVHAADDRRRRQRRQRVAADRLRAAPGGDPRQHGQPPPADPDGAH